MIAIRVKKPENYEKKKKEFYKELEKFFIANPRIQLLLRTVNYDDFVEKISRKLKKNDKQTQFKRFVNKKIEKAIPERELFLIFEGNCDLQKIKDLTIFEEVIFFFYLRFYYVFF